MSADRLTQSERDRLDQLLAGLKSRAGQPEAPSGEVAPPPPLGAAAQPVPPVAPVTPADFASAPAAPATPQPEPMAPAARQPASSETPGVSPAADDAEPVTPSAPQPAAPMAAEPAASPEPGLAPATPFASEPQPMAIPGQDPTTVEPATTPPAPQEDALQPADISQDPDLKVPSVNPEGFSSLEPSPAPVVPPPVPDVPPAASESDYVPAYAETEGAQVPQASEGAGEAAAAGSDPLAGFEPRDLLLSIAIVDPETESQTKATQSVMSMRKEAVLSDEGRRGKKSRIRMEPLPFETLTRGTPLIGTVYSPSGGVGKSSTAMNLAIYIAAIADTMSRKKRERGDENVRTPRVLILDGDIGMGSLALRLKGELTPSIHTLQLYIDDRESAGFTGDMAWPQVYENAPAGEKAMRDFVMWPEILPNLNLLAAPEEPDLFYDFGPAEFRNILRMLGRFYDVIIIDAGIDVVLESQRAWLAHAHEVFLITSPEIDRVYNASKAARYIAKARPHPQDQSPNPQKLPPLATREKISVVMTRYDADSGLDPEGVIDELFPWLEDHQKFFIPDVSADMLRANNQGKFLVLKNAIYAKVIGEMAQHLFARYAATRTQRALGAATVPQQQ